MTFFCSWDDEIQFGATARNSFVPEQNMELNELSCLSYDPSVENRGEILTQNPKLKFSFQNQTFHHNSSFMKVPKQCCSYEDKDHILNLWKFLKKSSVAFS